jgi:hypothetical protein
MKQLAQKLDLVAFLEKNGSSGNMAVARCSASLQRLTQTDLS